MMTGLTDGAFASRLRNAIIFAGLKPWPRLFHSMRSTRETELAESFPLQTACAWIGNSEQVAKKHYLQVLESHFEKAARNPAQPASAKPRQGVTRSKADNRETLDSRNVAKVDA